jgi:hypothetical protein|tara:strand:+ start:215 stop:2152 length:1938 start_codon:yes stop_codon:yes gene_type:complete
MKSIIKKSIIYVLLSLIFIGCDSTNDNAKDFGISIRPEPLRDFITNNVVKVSDFGALPDDDKTDTKAIQRAINQAKRLKDKVKIVFEPGIYRLDAFDEKFALNIDRAEDLIFDGNGAKFMMVRPSILFLRTSNSKRIIIRNFSVDYEISNHTQGWVTEINPEEKWLKVKIDSAWPEPNMSHFMNATFKWAFIKDKNNLPAYKEGTEFRLYLQNWERLKDNEWIYHTQYSSKLKTIEIGDPFVHISRVEGGGMCFTLSNSEDITLQNLRLYESPSMMIGSLSSTRINYIGIDISPKEGSWLSAGADGCFNAGGREGPWVEDCNFNALGDDNLIIKGVGAYVVDVVNDSTFALVRAVHRYVYPPLSIDTYKKRDSVDKWDVVTGDLLTVIDPLQKKIISEPLVSKIQLLPYSILVTTDRPIPGLRSGTSSDSSLIVLNKNTSLPRFVVKNNKFYNGIRFGFLLKSHDGIIENNLFENHSDQAIAMINTYQEIGDRVYNILIKGNRFVGAGGWPVKTAETAQHSLARENGRNIFSVVTTAFTVPIGQWDIVETEEVAIKNIHIVDNEFVNWRQLPALTVMNAADVSIINNSFSRDPMITTRDTLWLGKKPLRILYSKNVEVEGNKFTGEDISSEPVRIIKSEDVKIRN